MTRRWAAVALVFLLVTVAVAHAARITHGLIVASGLTVLNGIVALGSAGARVVTDGSGTLGLETNDTTRWQVAVTSGNLLAATDNAIDVGASGATRPRDAYVARNLHVAGYLHVQAALTLGVHAVTIAADGTTNANAEILAGLRPVLAIYCNDGNNCTLRVSETGVESGTVLRVVNMGANSILVGDHTTVGTRQHLAGAFTGTTNATLQLILMRDQSGSTGWYELGRSVN